MMIAAPPAIATIIMSFMPSPSEGGGGVDGGGARGGEKATTAGALGISMTATLTLLTLASMVVAWLGDVVAAAKVACTLGAVDATTRMTTSRRTLPDVIVTVTAEGATPASLAMAASISVLAVSVKLRARETARGARARERGAP